MERHLNFINTIVYTNFSFCSNESSLSMAVQHSSNNNKTSNSERSITFAIFQRCEVILYDEFYKNLSNEEINVQLLLIHDKILEILKKIEIIVSFLRDEMNSNGSFKSIKGFNKV
ncbi:CIC_collapsed_G0024440.mRNA.1.CDS.1 [Saccharomyces cerevisiae]|nr:CIC_collapsed_G0024440.mRNA.1.CDS.1 [Saccharomyces cerevisiae]